MDDEENENQLINYNSSKGKRAQVIASDDDIEESDDEPGSEEDEDEDGEEEDGDEEEDVSGSEEDDDEEDGEEEEDEEDSVVGGTDANTRILNDAQSSDEETENCPICLNGFRNQVVGTPENCNHYFCLDCIVEWSKNANSCPVDRIAFTCIHIRAHFGGEILKKVPVQIKGAVGEEEEDDVTNCEVCGRSDREDRLLLCDGCDSGYHMECLTPPLDAVPVDEWFCPECAEANQPEEDADHVSEEEVTELLADVVPTTSRLRTNAVRTRAIARTRQSERVRANVNRSRISRARNIRDVPSYLMSPLLDETIETVVAGLNTAVYQRNFTPRPAKRKRKRKYGRKKTTTQLKGTKGTGKKRRRRVKRRKFRKQTARKLPTSHSRIAKSLRLCSPTRGTLLPRVQHAPEHTLGSMRHDIGAAPLSVFGSAYDLDPFDSSEDNVFNPVSPYTAKRKVLSRSAMRSHQPVARPISMGMPRGGAAPPASESIAVAEPVPDLLGSILSGQSILMMKSADVIISRDGSLTAKKPGEASLQKKSSKEVTPANNHKEPCSSLSQSPASTSSSSAGKSIGQQLQLTFPSSGLYSLSPSPSPPPSSPSALERLSMANSGISGTSAFRLKNAFTPRAVQVQASAANRSVSKPGEPPRFNGTLHKLDPPSSNDQTPSKRPEDKNPLKPPSKRLDISELPRIPKIKREIDDKPNKEVRKQSETSVSISRNTSFPSTCVNQLTGRESHQSGSVNTTENRIKSSRQESQEQQRHSIGDTSSHTSSGSGPSLPYSSSSRSVGSSDVGGGGLRITISGSSENSCRVFSPSSRDPFRCSEGKTQQKVTPVCTKKEKPFKNEIYDPFDPTGSDSGSPSTSPKRHEPSPPPSAISAPQPSEPSPPPSASSAPQPSGKVGGFRSFKLTTHSSKIVSKLGPVFSDLSPKNSNKDLKNLLDLSPLSTPYIKAEKEIKKEVLEEDEIEHTPFRISCPLSGLKITSDLKPGGSRGFHFDHEDKKEIKCELETLPSRVIHQSTLSNRLVWESKSPGQSQSPSVSIELVKKEKTAKEELKVCSQTRSETRSKEKDSRSEMCSKERESKSGTCLKEREFRSGTHSGERESKLGTCSKENESRSGTRSKEREPRLGTPSKERESRSGTRSKERESRSASLSLDEGKDKRSKNKTHKRNRDRSDGSSSCSYERSKKKRPKEKKKEKKRKNSESKERKRSRSSSHSSSSQRMYNSKKKKKKKHRSRSDSRSISPERDRRRKHRYEKSYALKERGMKGKEKKRPKEEREKQRSRSPQMPKEYKAHKSKEKNFRLITEEKSHSILQSLEEGEKSFACTLTVETEYQPVKEEIQESPINLPIEEIDSDSYHSLDKVAILDIKQEKSEDSSGDELDNMENKSPPWSPSILDSLLPKDKSENVQEPPPPQSDIPALDGMLPKVEVISPQDSPSSALIDPPSPKSASPHSSPSKDKLPSVTITAVKSETDDLQWSPSHLDDFLLNELSDEVCSVEEASPDDVDLEEAILMKQDHKDTVNIFSSQAEVIPFLQDGNTTDEEAGNPIDDVKEEDSDSLEQENAGSEAPKADTSQASLSKTKPHVKRVTWNLQEEENSDTEKSTADLPFYKLQRVQEDLWPGSPKETNSPLETMTADSPSQSPNESLWEPTTLPWDIADKPKQIVSQMQWKSEDRSRKEINQLLNAIDTPIQVFPQTLPLLPLPPMFPTYAPVSEPTVSFGMQGSLPLLGSGEMLSQTPKPGSLATTNEPKMQAANTGEGKGKAKPSKKGEKGKNDEYMKKLHIQERAVEEVKLAIKPFYQKREITKEEYKDILRKAVQKICHSKSGEINPVKVVNLVKAYVDRYKHLRKHKKTDTEDYLYTEHDSPV